MSIRIEKDTSIQQIITTLKHNGELFIVTNKNVYKYTSSGLVLIPFVYKVEIPDET